MASRLIPLFVSFFFWVIRPLSQVATLTQTSGYALTNQIDSDLLNTVLQLLTSEGSSGFAEGLRLLVNEAMLQERATVLQARPYERSDDRLGRANGFKPKTLATRVGPIQFRIPQVRDGVDFYPSALEKGARSEKALLLALAEMYVQGVSTRKVTKIVEELCGHSVSSTQVSTCAAKLDVELQSWRDRPLGSYSYMILGCCEKEGHHTFECWEEEIIYTDLFLVRVSNNSLSV